MPTSYMRPLRAGLIAFSIAACNNAWAQAGNSPRAVTPADPLDKRLQLDLQPQPLSSAIIALSKLADVQLVMAGSLSGHSTAGLRGEMSLREALTRLLAGTGATFRKANADTIAIDLPRHTAADDELEGLLATTPNEGTALAAADGDPEVLLTIPVPNRETAAAEPSPARAPSSAQLEEIVVTATKREKSAREIPVSITALRGEDLEKIGARDVQDYLMQAPGITLVDSQLGEASGRSFTVRGVGPGDSSGLGNQTMGQFLGDVPLTDPFGNFGAPDLDPYDLSTVEVLRGPQGTTFGASALNGALRYVPKQPEFDRWQARGFVERTQLREGGTGHTYALGLNAPLGETAAVRASGLLQNAPGLYDNLQRGAEDADNRRKWSVRGAARWEPTEKFSVNVMALKQQSRVNDVLQADNGEGRFENNRQPWPSFIEFGFSAANLDLRYESDDWGTLVFQNNWQQKSSVGDVDSGVAALGQMGIESLRAWFDYGTRGNSQELRLVSPDGDRWEWIVGVFRRDYKADIIAHVNLLNLTVMSAEILPLNAEETAVFGELTRRLGESWEVTVGARRYTTSLNGSYITEALDLIPIKRNQIQQDEDGINPKFSLVYKPSADFMAYATLSRGFQFGGINNPLINLPIDNPVTGVSIPSSYGSSVLWNREIGIRTDWLDRTLRVDFALFDIRWEDAQLQQYTGGMLVNNQYIDNVGSVKSRGAEASLTWLTPLEGLSFSFNGAYVSARTAEPYEIGGQVVPAGSELPAVARVQTSTTLGYNTQIGNWAGGAQLSYAQWGRAYSDLKHTHPIFDFDTWGLNFSLARPDLRAAPSLSLNIANLTDERGVVGRSSQGLSLAGMSSDSWTYIRPLTISLRLSAEFN